MALGNEKRGSILPLSTITTDLLGPSYSFADEIPMPNEIGVRQGDTLRSVMDSVKGVAYYADMIGYGEASNPLTRSMQNKPFPLGVNYFFKGAMKCSNGADAWMYMNGIPEGNALGERVKTAMANLGLPKLRGLAPGIIEDAKGALDPKPIMNAVFGSGYAKCKQVTMPVGDFNGKLRSREGNEWIRPLFPGDIKQIGGRPHQTRWVLDRWVTQDIFQKEKKVFCPDGSRKSSRLSSDCSKGFDPLKNREGFTTAGQETSILEIILLSTFAITGTVLVLGFFLPTKPVS